MNIMILFLFVGLQEILVSCSADNRLAMIKIEKGERKEIQNRRDGRKKKKMWCFIDIALYKMFFVQIKRNKFYHINWSIATLFKTFDLPFIFLKSFSFYQIFPYSFYIFIICNFLHIEFFSFFSLFLFFTFLQRATHFSRNWFSLSCRYFHFYSCYFYSLSYLILKFQ